MKIRIIKGLIIIMLFYLLLGALLPYLSGINEYQSDLLDDEIKTTIVSVDGTVSRHDNTFPIVNRGDMIVVSIPLDDKYFLENATLCFHMEHCTVKVLYMDQVLFEYGEDMEARGEQIGSIYPKVYIPLGAWGHEITLICKVTENSAFTKLRGFTILPTEFSVKYEMIDHQLDFALFIAFAVLSMFMFVFLLFSDLKKRGTRQGLYLAIFGFLISVWILSTTGLLQFYVDNETVAENLEYLSLYAIPTPMVMVFYEKETRKRIRRLLLGFAAFLFLFFVVCTYLNFNTVDYHYVQTIIYLHIFMVVGSIGLLLVNLQIPNKKEPSTIVLQISLSCLIVAAIADIARYNLDRYTDLNLKLISVAITPLGVLLFICGGVVSMFIFITNGIMNQKEKDHLTKLAYLDFMTGIANRAGCEKELEDLKQKQVQDYAIVFFDLNNLKHANDIYGHDIGDIYIKGVAEVIKDIFGEIGFCGRMGGDEFIAVITTHRSRIVALYIEEFDFRMDRLNRKKIVPFAITVARGSVLSTRKVPIPVEEAIKMADEHMYFNKQRFKKMKKNDEEYKN